MILGSPFKRDLLRFCQMEKNFKPFCNPHVRYACRSLLWKKKKKTRKENRIGAVYSKMKIAKWKFFFAPRYLRSCLFLHTLSAAGVTNYNSFFYCFSQVCRFGAFWTSSQSKTKSGKWSCFSHRIKTSLTRRWKKWIRIQCTEAVRRYYLLLFSVVV